MQRCLKCGRENADGMRFCTNCGASALTSDISTPGGSGAGSAMDTSNSETMSFNTAPQTSPGGWATGGYPGTTPPAETPRKNPGLVIGLIVGALLLGVLGAGVLGAWYYYSSSSGSSNRGTDLSLNLNDNANNRNGSASPTPKPSPSPSPRQSFDPPTVPTKDGTFTVYANGGWQMSNIAVVPLEEFKTSVEGIIDVPGVKVGLRAGGTNDAKFKSRRLFQDFPTGALLMRTRYADGRYSNMVATGVSGSWQNLPDERGMLEFAINDNAPQSNGGQFTIRIRMTSVPKK